MATGRLRASGLVVLLVLLLAALPSPAGAADVVSQCLYPCHSSMGLMGPDVETAYLSAGENSGHALNWNQRVVESTSSAQLPQGARMPCTECHVAHGANGSSIYLFSTTRTGSPILAIRDLCTGCHREPDAMTVPPTVLGLAMKRLPATVEDHGVGSSRPCSDCHGSTGHSPEGHGDGSDCGDEACHGGSGSHAIHLQASDARGPGGMPCEECHESGGIPYFASGTDADASGEIELDETDVCDECHSPGGSYNGVSSSDGSIGAKDNWATRVYETADTLQTGKEKWCAGCHDGDENQTGDEPSLVDGVYAPAVIGDESADYIYGTGWGFYETGHGTPTSTVIASNGFDPGPGLECDGCHDYTQTHIDGNRRTFSASGATPTTYRTGYRLDLVNGNEPMLVPWTGATANSADAYRLCSQSGCHDSYPFTTENSSDRRTNFWNEIGTGDPKHYNMHKYHLEFANQLRWAPDWGSTLTSRITCVSCHNVHGSKYLGMIQDGELISDTVERRPGLRIWYWDDTLSSWAENDQNPPTPEDVTLAMSEGWVWSGASSIRLCSHCHGNWNTLDVPRTLWQSYGIAPVLDWTGEAGYEADGANPDSGSADAAITFKITYSDANNDAPTFVALRIDLNDDGDFADTGETVTMDPELPSDLTYYNGNPYSVSLEPAKAGDNVLSYYFETTNLGGDASTPVRTVSVTNSAPTLPWTGEAGYLDDGVNPNSGTTEMTPYEFRIRYRDLDGEAPVGGVTLQLDANDDGDFDDAGESRAMTDMGDPSYTVGKRYSLTTTITAQGDDSIIYRFSASDGIDGAETATKTVTVLENVNLAPSLAWTGESGYEDDGADPESQAAGKPFFFRIEYADANNEAPGVAQVWVDLDDDATYEAGEKFTMDDSVTSTDTAMTDGDYANGEIFAEKVYVAGAGDDTMDYCFYFEDSSAAEATGVHLTDRTLSVYDAIDVPSEFATIQAAIDSPLTVNGDTILVADGTYAGFHYKGEDIVVESINGAESTTVTGTVNVVEFNSYGGSGSDSTLRGFTVTGGTYGVYSNLSNTTIEECIIEGNSVGVYHTGASADPLVVGSSTISNNTGHGIQTTNVGARLTLTDTTIATNGGDGVVQGGGVNVIERCLFSDNSGAGYTNSNGGTNVTMNDSTLTENDNRGVYAAGGTYAMERCVISTNTVTGSGAGMYVAGTVGLVMSDCFVSSNTASVDGGGIHFNGNASCNVTIDRTYMIGNTAGSGQGGALYFGQGAYQLRNMTISGNYAGTNGGGVAVNNGGVTFTNCTLSGNSGYTGGALWVNLTSNGQSKVHNSVFWGDESRNTVYEEIDGSSATSRNRVEVQYTDINQTSTTFYNQTGNVTTMPLYVAPVAPADAPTTSGDYHLQSSSSIEGLASATYAPEDDIDGGSRPQGSGDDMGSDEIGAWAGGSAFSPAMDAVGSTPWKPSGVPILGDPIGIAVTLAVDETDGPRSPATSNTHGGKRTSRQTAANPIGIREPVPERQKSERRVPPATPLFTAMATLVALGRKGMLHASQ